VLFFWFWLVTLFLFSAYGVFSSLLLYIEGPVIMRDSLSDSKTALQQLENSSREVLVHREWDKFAYEVRVLASQLHDAILPKVFDPRTSRFCGIGPQSKRIGDQLSRLLPKFEFTWGDDQDHDCVHEFYFQQLQQKYDARINDLLQTDPKKTSQRVMDKDQLGEELTYIVNRDLGSASKMISQLTSVSTFFPDLTLYYASTRIYSDIAQDYSGMYNKLTSFAKPEWLSVRAALASPAVEDIASPWRTPDVVISRANRATTWVFLLIAVTADVVASLLAANAAYVLMVRHAQLKFAQAAKSVAGTDVAYIWRPDPRP
jgi:hypothetical protein